jgi:hypothetical protein
MQDDLRIHDAHGWSQAQRRVRLLTLTDAQCAESSRPGEVYTWAEIPEGVQFFCNGDAVGTVTYAELVAREQQQEAQWAQEG